MWRFSCPVTGYYLYVESSFQNSKPNAKLVSSWRSGVNGGQCLKFHYFMQGKTMGSLRVQLELRGKQKAKYLIFLKDGDQGSEWKAAVGNIDVEVGSSYQVIIMIIMIIKRHPRSQGLFPFLLAG